MDKINGQIFKGMLESGCANLNNRKAEVDALNVFPVPDGDTGTNMSLTFTNGLAEVRKTGSDNLPVITKTLSRGLLMGARGNSGVILSQIFRGFHASVGEKTELDANDLSEAMCAGAKKAYKAVMRPVEGTILTVIRESSEASAKYLEENPNIDVNEYIDVLCKEAKVSLDNTPELLPILKEASVVDSGGAGLLAILDGFRAYLLGSPITESNGTEVESSIEHDAHGYRTEFILKLSEKWTHFFKEDRFRKGLKEYGNSPMIIRDGDHIKVRVSTLAPGEVLNLGQRFGEFVKIQIENAELGLSASILEEDTTSTKEEVIEEKEYGIITVCAGDGLKALFEEYRADYVVSGGQTMNPSTEDFVSAIKKIHAKHIFILPNNSNIIMAAKQAAEVTEDKDIIVLETKSVPQGLSACINFNPDANVEDNKEAMIEAIANVKTGQITYAIKDTVIDGRTIEKGDYMGIFAKDIRLTNKDKVEACCKLLDEMIDEDSEIVTLIQGIDASDEEVDAVEAYIEEHFDVDVDRQNGKQPVYCFILGVE